MDTPITIDRIATQHVYDLKNTARDVLEDYRTNPDADWVGTEEGLTSALTEAGICTPGNYAAAKRRVAELLAPEGIKPPAGWTDPVTAPESTAPASTSC